MAILDEIKNEILKNSELDGNEKICLIALLCSSDLDNLSELAALMGVTRNTAQMTVRSLRMKGYLKDSQIESDEAEISALRRLMSRERNSAQRNTNQRNTNQRNYGVRAGEEFPSFSADDGDDENNGGRETATNLDTGFESDAAFDLSFDNGYGANAVELKKSGISRKERAERLSKVLDVNSQNPANNSYKSRAAALYKKDSNVARAAKKIKEIHMPDYDAQDVMDSLESSEMTRAVSISPADTGKKGAKAQSARTLQPEKSVKPLSPEDRVMNLVEESITRSEAAIILGFAGGDYEKVESTYKRIRGTQIKDKVDALVKLLQAD